MVRFRANTVAQHRACLARQVKQWPHREANRLEEDRAQPARPDQHILGLAAQGEAPFSGPQSGGSSRSSRFSRSPGCGARESTWANQKFHHDGMMVTGSIARTTVNYLTGNNLDAVVGQDMVDTHRRTLFQAQEVRRY